MLALHFGPDRIDRLDAPRYFEVDIVALELLDNRLTEFFDKFRPVGFGFLDLGFDLPVIFRETVFQRQILQFAFDREQPQAVSQRSEQIDRFAGDFHLLMRRHRFQRTHVVQPVGDLDQDHPDVVGKRQQHFAEIFRLLRSAGFENARHFGQSVHHQRDFGSETAFDILHRIVGILDDIVQQGRDHRLDTEADFIHDDPGHRQRVHDVRLPGTAAHSLVSLLRQEKGPFDQIPVIFIFTDFGTTPHQFVKLLANHAFIFLRITHQSPVLHTPTSIPCPPRTRQNMFSGTPRTESGCVSRRPYRTRAR